MAHPVTTYRLTASYLPLLACLWWWFAGAEEWVNELLSVPGTASLRWCLLSSPGQGVEEQVRARGRGSSSHARRVGTGDDCAHHPWTND